VNRSAVVDVSMREHPVSQPVDHPEVRVIVVGRTDLEASLRRDPRIELVRARTTLQAIGELSNPREDPAARESIVLVSADSHPGTDARRFITAVRLVDPGARVLLVTSPDSAIDARAYDGVLDPSLSSEAVREILRRLPAPHSSFERHDRAGAIAAAAPINVAAKTSVTLAQASGQPTGMSAPLPHSALPLVPPGDGASGPRSARITGPYTTTATGDDADTFSGFGLPGQGGPAGTTGQTAAEVIAAASNVGQDLSLEMALVQAALLGRDVLDLAMQVLRLRFALAGAGQPLAEQVVFVAFDAGEPAAEAVRAEVRHRDRIFGWLVGPLSVPVVVLPVLQSQADWLACWLAMAHQHAELRRAALVDDLTGAWNRRYFERFLAQAIERAQMQRHTLSVLVFDIDNFKFYNDKYGHAAGDDILKEAVRLLQSVIRTSDRVCRIGGDEFAVVFYEPAGPREQGSRPPETINIITDRFQKQIAEARFPKLGLAAPGRLTVSGGLSTYPWDGRGVDELLEVADARAMQAKRTGKGRITLGPQLDDREGKDGTGGKSVL